jgi:hypothetical protein
MLAVNQRGQGTDLLQSLEGEQGVFEATGPNGQQYLIVCQRGQAIVSKVQQFQQGQQGQQGQPSYQQGQQGQQQGQQWQYRKITDIPQQTQPTGF